jgi:glucose 1-dehydrogenase
MTTSYPEFKGKRVLITGGTQGIGKAIGRRLAQHGAFLYLNYAHSDAPAKETLAEFRSEGFNLQLCKADLGRSEAIDAMLNQIHQSGPLDFLVCNAAYQEKNKNLFGTDMEVMQKTMAVNVFGNFQLIQKVAKEMVAAKRPGRMVISSSGHGTMVFEGTLAYDVSKAALNHMMRAAALDLIPHDIRLNGVQIGWTHTPGERKWFSEEQQNKLSSTIPIGRSATADEIAAVFEFLLSEQSSYVVGSLACADGGFMLRPNAET